FFFQAEDGIRDFHVTGVQTCALPISTRALERRGPYRALVCRRLARFFPALTGLWQTPGPLAFQRQVPRVTPSYAERTTHAASWKIGRASCRQRADVTRGRDGIQQEGR